MTKPDLLHLDLKLLSGLLYLLEERHVSRAAERMYLSQSAMSRVLNRLRELFDDPLFIRTGDGMVPTARALELEGPLRQALEQITGLFSKADFDPLTSRRTFRIQTTHYQAQAYVPTIAEAFYAMAPNASLETVTLTENSLMHQPANSSDLALCSEYIQVPSGYRKELLGREVFRCVMSRRHPLAELAHMTLDDYLNFPHVLVTMGGSSRIMSDELLGARARERRFAFRTPYFVAALETVGRTQLLLSTSGLLPDRFADQFGLVCRPLPVEFPVTRYYMAWSENVSQDPGLIWLRRLCAQVIQGLIPNPYLPTSGSTP